MDPKIVLELIVRRLQQDVGDIKITDYSYWDGETPMPSWRLHLATALETAKQALASANPDEMIAAALTCPTHERTGRALQFKHAQAARRRQGGTNRGMTQTAKQLEVWAPYIDEYRRLLAQGKSPIQARRSVKLHMTRDFSSAGSAWGSLSRPTKTIRKWLN